MSAINRFNPIRLMDKRRAIHFRQNVSRFHVLTAHKIESSHHLAIIKRRESTEASVGITPVFQNALRYGDKIAIKDEIGEYTYNQLHNGAVKISLDILKICGSGNQSKVAFLCPNSVLYTSIQWACWISGNIAVPLSDRHPSAMQEYFITDTNASIIITTKEYEALLKPIATKCNCPLIIYEGNDAMKSEKSDLTDTLDNKFYEKSTAMILYTSGSTGLPKGTEISHKALHAQIQSLAHAWKISEKDNLLHVLPLNHVHGIVNALICPLNVGATVVMHRKFDSSTVWSALLNVNKPSKEQITVFMAVPTIYSFLVTEYEKVVSKKHRMEDYIRNHCIEKIRLFVSGSAPLTSNLFERWHEISGHKLLERYGMTEIGMALSNPYFIDKVRDRIPGKVGLPLPGVEVKLINKGKTVLRLKGEYGTGFWNENSLPIYENIQSKASETVAGELYVRGPNIFTKYINRKEETEQSFSAGGWFKTGDEVQFENGNFKILGRTSVDIIKTGGYKVSALDVETQLLKNAYIKDACVVGVTDLVWGQKIAALIVSDKIAGKEVEMENFKQWCNNNITSYEIPTVLKFVKEIPRNNLGKVNKKIILKTFFENV